MSIIDTLIFDLGGVLVNWNPKNVYLEYFNGDENKTDWFLKTICTPEWNLKQDGGRKIADAEALLIEQYPEYKKEILLYYKKWHLMFSGVIEENLELFKNLKTSGNYHIYALTNWSAEKWDNALELFPFFNDFDGVVVSGKEKCKKPEKKIYDIIINRYNLKPNRSLFIDDNYDNIIAARSIGLNTVHFNDNVNLKSKFVKLNINF